MIERRHFLAACLGAPALAPWLSGQKPHFQEKVIDVDVPGAPITVSIEVDSDVPGPVQSLKLSRCRTGLKVQMVEPATNSKTVWGYDIQAQRQPFTGSTADAAGMLDVLAIGTAQEQERNFLFLTDPSQEWGPGEFAGKWLYTFANALPNPEEAIRRPMGWPILTNTGDTIIIDPGERNERPMPALIGPAYIVTSGFKTVENGALLVRDLDLSRMETAWTCEAKPSRKRRLTLGEPAFVKVRACNSHGCGATVYWDGKAGSTDRAKQVQFQP